MFPFAKACSCSLMCVSRGGEAAWLHLSVACSTSNGCLSSKDLTGAKFASPPPVPAVGGRDNPPGINRICLRASSCRAGSARGLPRGLTSRGKFAPPALLAVAAGPMALETVPARGLSTGVTGSACCRLCSQKKTSIARSSFKLTSFFGFVSSAAGLASAGLAVHAVRRAGFVKKVTSGSKIALISLRMIRQLIRLSLLMADL